MRGRRPSGPEYVDGLAGSALAKERLKVVLETLAGTCRVQEACQRLGISEPRFHQLRQRLLQAALGRLEPRPAGRPAQAPSAAQEEVGKLEEELAALRVQAQAAQTRAEIALALPGVLQKPPSAAEKKTRRRPP
jgi:Helix-turn-helix domain